MDDNRKKIDNFFDGWRRRLEYIDDLRVYKTINTVPGVLSFYIFDGEPRGRDQHLDYNIRYDDEPDEVFKRLNEIHDEALKKLRGMSEESKEESARDKAIKRVKILGQNLIDQAERLVPENVDYDSDPYLSIMMHINGDADIYFSQHLCSLVK